MSPARQHRERHAASANAPRPIGATNSADARWREPPTDEFSPARLHLIQQAAATMPATGDAPSPAPDNQAAQMQLRLVHDLRRLKEIQSIERKIAAKRDMLPAYAPWVDALLTRARDTGQAVAEPVLPTIMVWRIDTGDYVGALDLAEHIIAHNLPLPDRYKRTAATLVLEEVANAANARLGSGHPFPLDILERVEGLTADQDMPDEVRAKLHKAIGLELLRATDAGETDRSADSLNHFQRARDLHDRVGVTDKVRRLEKRLQTPLPVTPG